MTRKVLILILACLALYGCGGDTGTTPDLDDNETVLAADTIGTGGGVFSADGFQLVVPAGAFASDAELLLYESSEEHGFGENCISTFFRLDGLPESFAESLTVRVGYEGTVGSDPLVAMGRDLIFYDDDYDSSEVLAFDFLPATESSGYLEAVIPADHSGTSLAGASSVGAASKRRDHFAVLKDVEIKSKSEHVTMTYPVQAFGRVQAVADFIEAAHDTIISVGIGYEGRFWKWPILVTVKNLSEGATPVAAPVRYHLSPELGFWIQVHEPFVKEENHAWLRHFLGNLMTTAAQHIPSKSEYEERDHYPWNCAVAAWMQQYWPVPGDHTPPRFLVDNEIHALEGLPVGLTSGLNPRYGQSWTAVVKYLADRYGRSLIGNVYRNTQTSDEKPIADLMERIPDAAYNWWPDFVDDYVTGKIYGVEETVFLSAIPPDFHLKIRSAADTLFDSGTFLRQLSVAPYRLELDYALIPEGTAIRIGGSAHEVDMDWFTLLVYKTKDGVMEKIASGDTVTVGNLRDLTIAGYDLVAFCVLSYNDEPYDGRTLVSILCRLLEPQTYNYCKIRVGYTGEWQVGDDDPYWGYILPSWWAEGSFTGNTFSGQIAQWHHGDNTTGSMTVTIDPATMIVTYFSANATTVDEWGVSSWGLTGGGLPRTSYDPGYSMTCRIEGALACYYISSLQWSYVPVSGDMTALIDFMCDSGSGIELTFWK